MSNTYRQYRKNQFELFERFEQVFEDMVKYDENLVAFTPLGGVFATLLTDKELEELKSKRDKFLEEYKPGFEKDMKEILER